MSNSAMSNFFPLVSGELNKRL